MWRSSICRFPCGVKQNPNRIDCTSSSYDGAMLNTCLSFSSARAERGSFENDLGVEQLLLRLEFSDQHEAERPSDEREGARCTLSFVEL